MRSDHGTFGLCVVARQRAMFARRGAFLDFARDGGCCGLEAVPVHVHVAHWALPQRLSNEWVLYPMPGVVLSLCPCQKGRHVPYITTSSVDLS